MRAVNYGDRQVRPNHSVEVTECRHTSDSSGAILWIKFDQKDRGGMKETADTKNTKKKIKQTLYI